VENQSSEEIVARFIAQAFPAAKLKIEGERKQAVYEIVLDGQVLIRIDHIGAVFNFPTRGSGKQSWSGIMEGSPESIAKSIVRDLADAGFTVQESQGKRIQKRPIFIGSYTCCPQCNERGFIKWIVFGSISQELDSEKFVSNGSGLGFNDPDIKCVGCGWEGILEDVRFTKKIRG